MRFCGTIFILSYGKYNVELKKLMKVSLKINDKVLTGIATKINVLDNYDSGNTRKKEQTITMIKVLFICHGNICRSPMAEFLLKDIVAKRNIAPQFYIQSAATSTEEIGNPVHWGTREKLSAAGISCKGKTARQVFETDPSYYAWVQNGTFTLDTKAQFAKLEEKFKFERLAAKWGNGKLF